MISGCPHGPGSHDGTEPSTATAPAASRAWLLIEHPGPWPAEAADAALPPPARAAVAAAVPLGVRVQLIRRPGRHRAAGDQRALCALAGWTGGERPWLRRGTVSSAGTLNLTALAAGRPVTFGAPAAQPLFLVCTHGRRDACCARLGAPLARELAGRYPDQVWETTHVGGHRYAANLVILPHGLYYGPVGAESALEVIGAYQRGQISPVRYRGRAGQPHEVQLADQVRLTRSVGPPPRP
jgi:hypothetical protein